MSGDAPQRLSRDIDSIRSVPFLDGALLTKVTLTSGSFVRLQHGLGRRWSGYWVVGQFNASGAGYVYAHRTAMDAQFIELCAMGYTENPELNIWVF